jgi:hypothetical protein
VSDCERWRRVSACRETGSGVIVEVKSYQNCVQASTEIKFWSLICEERVALSCCLRCGFRCAVASHEGTIHCRLDTVVNGHVQSHRLISQQATIKQTGSLIT